MALDLPEPIALVRRLLPRLERIVEPAVLEVSHVAMERLGDLLGIVIVDHDVLLQDAPVQARIVLRHDRARDDGLAAPGMMTDHGHLRGPLDEIPTVGLLGDCVAATFGLYGLHIIPTI